MKNYTITLMDRYSAAERTVSVSALNEDHARRKVEKGMFEIIAAVVEDHQPAPEPAQQPQEEPQPATTYTRPDVNYSTITAAGGHADTESAILALSWHRNGQPVTVTRLGENHVSVVRIKPAHVITQKDKTDNENRDHCRRIAEELEAYTAGNVRRCPDCGELHARNWDSVGDVFRCPHCHAVTDMNEWDQLGIWDYMEDALDIEYRVSGKNAHEINSVQIMVAYGGPSIYIDTASAAIELYWWMNRAEYPISYAARDAINEWADDCWRCC